MSQRRRSLFSPPVFADRRTRALGLATLAGLVAVEAADLSVTPHQTDRVDDHGTGRTFAAAMAVAIVVATASLLRRNRRSLPRNGTLFDVGVTAVWLGLALNRWARHTLARNYRPLITVVEDHAVVSAGPYRFVRHPMYAGATLTCAGVAAALSTVPTAAAWMLPPAALVRRIVVEERVLSDALGNRYDHFAAGRSRLIPGVW